MEDVPHVVIITHKPGQDPGAAPELLQLAGCDVSVWCIPERPVPPAPDQYDGVVVLGGSMRLRDSDEYPWLHAEAAYLERVLADGVPALGICLGGQIFCQLAGGAVALADGPEREWIRVQPATSDDPLTHGLPPHFPGYTMHEDTTLPPPGSVEVFRGGHCPQGTRFPGTRAWALAFHPDVSIPLAWEWHTRLGEELSRVGRTPVQQHAHFLASYAASRPYSTRIFANFAAVCGAAVPEVDGEGGVGERLAVIRPGGEA